MDKKMKAHSNAMYVIDDDYRLVYYNEALRRMLPDVENGQYCYWALCREDAPCCGCPLDNKEKGGSVLWNRRLELWANAAAGEVEWPEAGACHFITANTLSGERDQKVKPRETEYLLQKQEGKGEIRINPLTALYYNKTFFQKADERLKTIQADTYCMVSIDVEHFRLFNKLYGREEGDHLLIFIGECLRKIEQQHDAVAGYMGGDNFGILMPGKIDLIKILQTEISEWVKEQSNTVGFLPGFGLYHISDPAVPALQMYDWATIALSHVIGNYMKRICVYDSSMVEKMEEEIRLLSEIQAALERDEFTFYVQPQCNIATGKIVGAESLVRWKHRTKGLIPPEIFIPVLEKNGFIADLDCCVWRKVCEWLRNWMDRGYHPVPISINVSRIDIFSMDVPAYLMMLIEEFRLNPKVLKVELTESAYAESNDKIVKTVERLRSSGFLVMMDDFGSGYSSLNMLKSVEVDILKLDMKFLKIGEEEEEKGINILESIVNMSKQMGLPIIVEGVETKKQEEFLNGMGCRYTQGYYYYKPMPVEEFEKLLSDESRLDFGGLLCRQVESMHLKEFLDDNLFNDATMNNILGPTAFYDVCESKIEIVRVNEQYYRLTGLSVGEGMENQEKVLEHVLEDDRQMMFSAFERASENPERGAECYIRFLRTDGDVLGIYMRIYFLREKNGHKLYYSSLTDVTGLVQNGYAALPIKTIGSLTDKRRQALEQSFGEMPDGYVLAKIILDEDRQPYDYEIIYVNREIERVTGGSMEMFRKLVAKADGDERDVILSMGWRAASMGETIDHYFYSPEVRKYLQLTMYQYEYGYVGCILRDVTHNHIYEGALRTVMTSYREVYFIHLDDNFYQMIYPHENLMLERGNYEASVNRHFTMGKINRDDEANIRHFLSLDNLRNALAREESVEYKYRRRLDEQTEEWCLTSFVVSERVNGRPKTATMTIRSIEAFIKREEEERLEQLTQTLAHMSDGFFIYRAVEDEQILFANPPLLRMYGCDSVKEFRKLVGNSFRGMVHPEDLVRIEKDIQEQIRKSDEKNDYIRYRIVRKDGTVRWVDDWGHLEESEPDGKLFYVFLADITDTITEKQVTELLRKNKQMES